MARTNNDCTGWYYIISIIFGKMVLSNNRPLHAVVIIVGLLSAQPFFADSCSFVTTENLYGVYIGNAIPVIFDNGLWTLGSDHPNILQAELFRYDNTNSYASSNTTIATIDMTTGWVTEGAFPGDDSLLSPNQPRVIQENPTQGVQLLFTENQLQQFVSNITGETNTVLDGRLNAVIVRDNRILIEVRLQVDHLSDGDYFHFTTNGTVFIVYASEHDAGDRRTMAVAVDLETQQVRTMAVDGAFFRGNKVFAVYPELQVIVMEEQDSCGGRQHYFYSSSDICAIPYWPQDGRAFVALNADDNERRPENLSYYRPRHFKSGSSPQYSDPPAAYAIEQVEVLTGNVIKVVYLRSDLLWKVAEFAFDDNDRAMVMSRDDPSVSAVEPDDAALMKESSSVGDPLVEWKLLWPILFIPLSYFLQHL